MRLGTPSVVPLVGTRSSGFRVGFAASTAVQQPQGASHAAEGVGGGRVAAATLPPPTPLTHQISVSSLSPVAKKHFPISNTGISPVFLALLLLGLTALNAVAAPATTNAQLPELVWTTPSTNAAGFMPVGNGDLGLNVWVEPDGDLFLYMGKTDAWDGFGRLLKLGRLRLALTPNPFLAGQPFRQELDLREGAVKITAGVPGQEVSLRVWVDANRPVAHVEAWAKQAVSLKVSLESWRTVKRPLTPQESGGIDGLGKDQPAWVEADVLVPGLERQLVWYQRNQVSICPATLRLQGLESLLGQTRDPLLDRTFGAVAQGAGLTNGSPAALCSVQPARQFDVQIHTLTAQTATAQAWQDQLRQQAQSVAAVPPERAGRSTGNGGRPSGTVAGCACRAKRVMKRRF